MTGYVKIISLVSLLAAFLILAAGCGPSKSIKGSANKAAIQTELEMISETTLRVTYVTGSPSAELFFSRTPDKQRQERWAALDENIIIEHRNGIDVIKHINGEKITRLYSRWYYLENLQQGSNVVSVALNANDHGPLVLNGQAVSASIKLIQE